MESTPESKYDLYYGRIVKASVQLLGMAGLGQQFFLASEPQPLILAVAGLMAGLPVARILEKALK